jgi:hypothetical protein
MRLSRPKRPSCIAPAICSIRQYFGVVCTVCARHAAAILSVDHEQKKFLEFCRKCVRCSHAVPGRKAPRILTPSPKNFRPNRGRGLSVFNFSFLRANAGACLCSRISISVLLMTETGSKRDETSSINVHAAAWPFSALSVAVLARPAAFKCNPHLRR